MKKTTMQSLIAQGLIYQKPCFRNKEKDSIRQAAYRLLMLLGLSLVSTVAFAASYSFSGTVGGTNYPTCIDWGSWSLNGNIATCSSSINLLSGDSIVPNSTLTIVANAGITLQGSNTVGSSSVTVSLQTTYGDISTSGTSTIYGNVSSSSGKITMTNATVNGNVSSSTGNITMTNTTVNGTATTNGTISLSGGSVTGNVSGKNGVTSTNGTVFGGTVSSTNGSISLSGGSVAGNVSGKNGVTSTNATVFGGTISATNGSISLSGGSVAGNVSSNCCSITTNSTNLGNGATSSSNTVQIAGGTIAGTISSSGGNGVILSNVIMTSGSISTTNVPISISNSSIGSSSAVAITTNNTIIISGSTVTGNVTAASWPGALSINSSSTIYGVCTSSSNSTTNPPDYPHCVTGGAASSFSAIDEAYGTSPSVQSYLDGHIYTKLAGIAFKLDVAAINNQQIVNTYAAGANKNVTIKLVDNSDAGCTLDSSAVNYCNAVCIAKTAVASQTLTFTSANSGRMQSASFTIGSAYRNLAVVMSDGVATACSADAFSVRPQKFTLSTTAALNPATNKLAAGEDFNLTANLGVTIGYNGTPVVNTASVVDHVAQAVNAMLSWNNPTLSLPGAAAISGFPQAVGGSVSNNFQYNDVGTITFNADAVTDTAYTGIDQSSNDCVTGSTSNTANSSGKFGCTIGSSVLGPLGRFYPHHFAVNARFDHLGCDAGGFTYMDNDALGLILNVTAQSKANNTTTRYVSPASTYVPVASLGVELLNGANATNLLSRLSQPSVPARSWTLGVYTADNTYRFDARNATPQVMDGAYDSLKIRTKITDATDGVQITKFNGASETAVSSIDSATTMVRFGRISLQNAYGSELLDLPMPLTAEYWDGSSWVTNSADSCTVFPASSIIMDNYFQSLNACETRFSPAGNLIMSGGILSPGLNLTAPGSGNTGSVNLTLNIGSSAIGNTCATATQTSATAANMPWLGVNPTARATFGIYKGNSKLIYIRELY
ncbi:DUF6701 domain-containing protein [Methylobacter sp.]|uniref:DUF6701 domain-containing protein n=1 Tax=Methylobacter sp. TaxID=2051955 RepID=UPI00248A5091|nr:DUF6701 domain-containing protein [Methylobacter sp.]MDI1276226.1 hypothetical protein [Methylobacter sp.]MDI1356886.1 hypothetical protein [Methylobacter sp.]